MNKTIERIGAKVILVLLIIAVASPAMASRDGYDEHRDEYYGIIEQRPQNGLHGEWTIGDQTFSTDRGTDFDETEGLLEVGRCAKVEFRNGRVHEIEGEPPHDCQ